MHRARITCQRESNGKGVTYTKTVIVSYKQEWHAYNAAQTSEKAMFVPMLADLCKLVPSPPQTKGRPRVLLSYMAFAAVLRTGDGLLSKTVEAQDADILTKFVAHNLCVLIQAFHELGIESRFDGMSAPARRMAVS